MSDVSGWGSGAWGEGAWGFSVYDRTAAESVTGADQASAGVV